MADGSADNGPVALVTGGTRGIGRAITERLVADGWSVLATYRSDTAAAERLAAHQPGLVVRQAAGADEADCRATVDDAVGRWGGLDHLVLCAGISRDAPVAELTDDDWSAVLDADLSGPFRMARAALAPLAASRRGRIVAVSSVAATMGNAGQAAYASAKAGLLGLTRTLARELARTGTTVNLVVPGPTADTGLTADADPAFVAAIQRRIPVGRLGRPEEVAHAVRYLLDDLAAFTTGTSVTVDGGLSM